MVLALTVPNFGMLICHSLKSSSSSADRLFFIDPDITLKPFDDRAGRFRNGTCESVFPEPGGPSTSNGLPSFIARYTTGSNSSATRY